MRPRAFNVALLFVVLVGCDDSTGAELCIDLGLCQGPPPPPPVEVVIVIDATPGSTGNLAILEQLVDRALAATEERPNSVIAVWNVGEDARGCREVAAATVPEPPARLRARRAYLDRTRNELRAALVEPMTPVLAEATTYGHSEVALTLTLAGRAPRRAPTRTFLVTSDLRERSTPTGNDIECADLSARRFERALARRGLLDGTFTSFDTVELLDLGALPDIPGRRRCPTSLRRAAELRELWRTSLEAAGARVLTPVGSPVLDFPVTLEE